MPPFDVSIHIFCLKINISIKKVKCYIPDIQIPVSIAKSSLEPIDEIMIVLRSHHSSSWGTVSRSAL